MASLLIETAVLALVGSTGASIAILVYKLLTEGWPDG